MKSEKQIEEYLKSKEWYDRYLHNIKKVFSSGSVSNYTLGRKSYNTIRLAFNWKITDEGYDYWADIDKEFREWFNSKNE